MRSIAVALALIVVGCHGPDSSQNSDERVGARKPIEADEDFLQTRSAYERQSRARLARLDARIAELGDNASVELRARRDQIAKLVDEIGAQGETAWDTFRGQLDRTFAEAERQLNGS